MRVKKNTINKSILIYFSICLLVLTNNVMNYKDEGNTAAINSTKDIEQFRDENSLKLASDDDILFQGTSNRLNISNYGNLYENNKEISINNQDIVNLTYYLDDAHDWKVSDIKTSISNIEDTRNWVNNSEFKEVQIFRKYQVYQSSTHYGYQQGQDYLSIKHTITQSGALFMRAHFMNISFEVGATYDESDQIYLYNKTNWYIYYEGTGFREDFYSPWISGDSIRVAYHADNTNDNGPYYGYYIDHYEFVNSSSNLGLNTANWKFKNQKVGLYGANNYGSGNIGEADAMYVGYYGDMYDYYTYQKFLYESGSFSEMYQENITVPRGKIVDAYISFDYFLDFGFETNNILMYLEINNKKVYSRGLLDIITAGKSLWHSTGNVPLYLWDNLTNVFEPADLDVQTLNISVGIKNAGGSVVYSGFDDVFGCVIWFDNITFGLSALANSTQSGIKLKINNQELVQGNGWGKASLNQTGTWDTNPITVSINTTSPSLSFKMNTTLFGYKNATSKINQQNVEGVSCQILNNGTIFWQFLHNFYNPAEYSDFEFIIDKPKNWIFLSVLDPTFQSRNFEGGKLGDLFLKVNSTNAVFPGWWTFKATSANYLTLDNTKVFKEGQWVHTSFKSGESTRIKTQVNNSNDIPPNIVNTYVNLTIYDPQGDLWHQEGKTPLSNGSVVFSEIFFNSLNTMGGQYNYTLFWSNGTALGGLKSNFLIIHNCSLLLIKPNDAVEDLITEAFLGDIIPLRIALQDSENNDSISDAIISYNWTSDLRYFEEAALGIYEAILDTADLVTKCFYKIFVNSSILGYTNYNLTLNLYLEEETSLRRLESASRIEMHANGSIRFRYYSDRDSSGIINAEVDINITNPAFYTVQNQSGGYYLIEFNSSFIRNLGIYELVFNFSAPLYEPQTHIFQFEIVEQSVNLLVSLNYNLINENDLLEVEYNDLFVIESTAFALHEKIYLSEGIMKFVIGSTELNISESQLNLYTSLITVSTSQFSLGLNYVYIQFQKGNYTTTRFSFQLMVNQMSIDVIPIDFEDSIETYIGEKIKIELKLMEPDTQNKIKHATVSYSWDFGVGKFEETSDGTYALNLKLPENIEGTYKITLVISKEGSVYKTREFSFLVVITEKEGPNLLIWIILSILIGAIGVLGTLSLRSYVLLPRKRRRESELLLKTQRFKDLRNIQGIVIINKLSGIPIYSQNYSILENQKKELFSGFIQAITLIGEEISGEKTPIIKDKGSTPMGVEKIIELDFNKFHCLIVDNGDLRIVLILKEKASDRLKDQMSNFSLSLCLHLSEQLENWDGSLSEFEIKIPEIMKGYLELHYKEPFKFAGPATIAQIKKEGTLTSMETRIINVIYSFAKGKSGFPLNTILELVSEENKNLVIEGIEALIQRGVLVPATKEKEKFNN